jgi:hypothetical protein
MSAKKNNYKAKWLAALAEAQASPSELANDVEKLTTVLDDTSMTTQQNIERLHEALIGAGRQATNLCELMNECNDFNLVKFKQIDHMIDSKISKMPSMVIARRIRDVTRYAEERIGILSTMCESHERALSQMHERVQYLEIGNRKLQKTLMGTVLIGKNPSSDEIEALLDGDKIRRDGGYESVDEDESALLTGPRSHDDDYSDVDNTHSDDERESDPVDNNKTAVVVKKHHKVDSGYAVENL